MQLPQKIAKDGHVKDAQNQGKMVATGHFVVNYLAIIARRVDMSWISNFIKVQNPSQVLISAV
jgi:hypothetical protein